MSVLVTGGAGFIGSNLVRSLVASGEHVRVLDDMSTGHLGNLDHLAGTGGGIRLFVGTVEDPAAVREAVDGVEVVYHLGALASVGRSIADPVRVNRVNVGGTLNVLVAARDASVRRVVFASSSSIYGDSPALPKHEGLPPAPRSPYAASKLAGEAYCRSFAAAFGLQTVALRFFNVFGPHQDPASEYAAVIPSFVTRMLDGEAPVIFGDGTQSRDFTHVSNAVQACLLASSAGPEVAGRAFNVACGERVSLLDVVEHLNRLLCTSILPVHAPPRTGDVRHSLASIERAERMLGYRPLVTFEGGLAATIEWYADGRRASGVSRRDDRSGVSPGIEPDHPLQTLEARHAGS